MTPVVRPQPVPLSAGTPRAIAQRSCDDGCAAAHALDHVGERWALLVVRELLLGPRRFTDPRANRPGISPHVLSQRLRDLEDIGGTQEHA